MTGDYRQKIQELPQVAATVKGWKRGGERVVVANGCFDVLHVGHVRYLQAARREGDRLVVALNSDSSTRALKGAQRPILGEQARAELVAALGCTDLVVIFAELTVEKVLRTIVPAVHAKGTDYTADTVPERALAAELGYRIAITGDPKDHSTRDLLRDIAQRVESENNNQKGGANAAATCDPKADGCQ